MREGGRGVSERERERERYGERWREMERDEERGMEREGRGRKRVGVSVRELRNE